MSTSWRELRSLFIRATGEQQNAIHESWDHLTFAYRDICARKELPELYQPDARTSTTASQDYIATDVDLYSIHSIVDLSNGRHLEREPEGNQGRRMFIAATTGMPPEGDPQFYVRSGNRIYLRPTPPDERELQLVYRFHPAELAEADLDLYPITPPQYDEAILWLALYRFYLLHPHENPDGSLDHNRAEVLRQQAELRLVEPKNPPGEEQRSMRSYVRQPGYSFNIN